MARIPASEISGYLQERFGDNTQALLAAWVPKFLKRLENDLNRISAAHVMVKGYEGILIWSASWDGEKRITVTPSDPDLFRKLEMGEFDENGRMITTPYSVLEEWRVEVKVNKS